MFPQLAQFTDFGLLALRLMVAVIFISSGWSHLDQGRGEKQEHRHEQRLYYFPRVLRKWREGWAWLSACSLNSLRWD